MQVSILLVAAAALERTNMDEGDAKDTITQQTQVQGFTNIHSIQQPQVAQQHRPPLPPPTEHFSHESTIPHSYGAHAEQPGGNAFHYSAIQPPHQGFQLPSLHELSKRPPPPFPYGPDVPMSSEIPTQQEPLIHGFHKSV